MVLAQQEVEPALTPPDENDLDLLARRPEDRFELAQRDLLLLFVASDRVGLLAEIGLQLLVRAEQLEPLQVERRRRLALELTKLVTVPVARQNGQLGDRGSERELLTLEGKTRRQDRVLELVVLLRQLRGDQTALTGLPQSIQPLAPISLGLRLLVAEGAQLVAAEEILVARHDRRLLRDLFLADANGAAFFGPLEAIPL